jgi:hypothetical protein
MATVSLNDAMPDLKGLCERQRALVLAWWGLYLYSRLCPDDPALGGLRTRVHGRMSMAAIDRVNAVKWALEGVSNA